MRTDSLQLSSRHWSDWVAALRSEYGARPTLALLTDASDCSSWPTAQARDYRSVTGNEIDQRDNAMQNLNVAAHHWPTAKAISGGANSKRKERGAGGPDLQEAVKHWPTPTSMSFADSHQPGNCASHNEMLRLHEQWMTPNVPNGGRTASHAQIKGKTLLTESGKKVQLGLEHQARHWPTATAADSRPSANSTANRALGATPRNKGDTLTDAIRLWPTPAARDYKGTNSEEHAANGRGHLCQLPNFVEHCFSLPAQAIKAGPRSSETRRTLNPLFVEWLMGWPIGWTASEPVETGLSHWLRLMRGALSTLCSPMLDDPQQRLF